MNNKLASSVNKALFAHFLKLSFGPIFKNCLLGPHPQTPLNNIYDVGYMVVLTTYSLCIVLTLSFNKSQCINTSALRLCQCYSEEDYFHERACLFDIFRARLKIFSFFRSSHAQNTICSKV